MAQHAIAAQKWKSAVLYGLTAPTDSIAHGSPVPDALRGQPFANFRDPFDPLLEIWRAGYAIAQERQGHLVLVAPLRS